MIKHKTYVGGIWTGFGAGGLPIAYGFLRHVKDEAYGLFMDFYRMWRTRLADCLRMMDDGLCASARAVQIRLAADHPLEPRIPAANVRAILRTRSRKDAAQNFVES